MANALATANNEGSGGNSPAAGSPTASPGHVLDLIRRSGGLTRAEILDKTGLSRMTVAARLETLQTAGWISSGQTTAVRGRPPSHFYFRAEQGAFLIANAGATGVRAAFTDLNGQVIEERRVSIAITVGPDRWLTSLIDLFDELLQSAGKKRDFIRGIAIGVPGPVDFASATVVSPPIMTGWDGYPIRAWFAERFSCPVLVDNDANAMTLGEHTAMFAEYDSLVTVKVATGIGAGIIAHGEIYRGADGAAGDIGHIPISPPADAPDSAVPVCRCGKAACLEAYAGGWALIRDLCNEGRNVATIDDAVRLAEAGDPLAVNAIRRAGRLIGSALSDVVSLLNPSVVVIGGELSDATDDLIAGIRERIYARSAPLASRRLQVVPARLGDRSGIVGLSTTLADHIFDPHRVDAALA